jgi:hypothetical protein
VTSKAPVCRTSNVVNNNGAGFATHYMPWPRARIAITSVESPKHTADNRDVVGNPYTFIRVPSARAESVQGSGEHGKATEAQCGSWHISPGETGAQISETLEAGPATSAQR